MNKSIFFETCFLKNIFKLKNKILKISLKKNYRTLNIFSDLIQIII